MNEVERQDLKPDRTESKVGSTVCGDQSYHHSPIKDTHTHKHSSNTDIHKTTHTWLQIRLDKATEVSMDEGNRERGRGRDTYVCTDTQSSIEPGKISPVPNK